MTLPTRLRQCEIRTFGKGDNRQMAVISGLNAAISLLKITAVCGPLWRRSRNGSDAKLETAIDNHANTHKLY